MMQHNEHDNEATQMIDGERPGGPLTNGDARHAGDITARRALLRLAAHHLLDVHLHPVGHLHVARNHAGRTRADPLGILHHR